MSVTESALKAVVESALSGSSDRAGVVALIVDSVMDLFGIKRVDVKLDPGSTVSYVILPPEGPAAEDGATKLAERLVAALLKQFPAAEPFVPRDDITRLLADELRALGVVR